MEYGPRIAALKQWGAVIKSTDWSDYYEEIQHANNWFVKSSIDLALLGINELLDPVKLDHWHAMYQKPIRSSHTVGVIMAGNIPLVGLHDLICLFVSGHSAMIKLSSQDQILLPILLEELFKIQPSAKSSIRLASHISAAQVDAIIATGSDNTSRYIKYQYRKLPRIIRKNRVSMGIITGKESPDQLAKLGVDIFSHFGRGCRNVSKLLLPPDYDINKLFALVAEPVDFALHPKYRNNYLYQKALSSAQGLVYLDLGYALLRQNKDIHSPLSVVYYDYYHNQRQLDEMVQQVKGKTQCIASAAGWYNNSIPFGQLQQPDLWDYADDIDTMQFLIELG